MSEEDMICAKCGEAYSLNESEMEPTTYCVRLLLSSMNSDYWKKSRYNAKESTNNQRSKMNIEWKRCAVVDGIAYPSLEDAKLAMLEKLFGGNPDLTWTPHHIAAKILDSENEVLNALTFTDASRPKARKANGAVRKPRKKEAPTATEP